MKTVQKNFFSLFIFRYLKTSETYDLFSVSKKQMINSLKAEDRAR